MSYNGLYSPLNINCLGSLLQNVGLTINTQLSGLSYRINSNSGTGSVATVLFPEQNVEPFLEGETLYIKNAIPSEWNGNYTVISCTKTYVTFYATHTSAITNVNDGDETLAFICSTGILGVTTGPSD